MTHDVHKCRVCCNRLFADEASHLAHELAKLYLSGPRSSSPIGLLYELTSRGRAIESAAAGLASARGIRYLAQAPRGVVEDIFAEAILATPPMSSAPSRTAFVNPRHSGSMRVTRWP